MTKEVRDSLRVWKIRHFHFRDFQWEISGKSYNKRFRRVRKPWKLVDERTSQQK